MEDGAALPGSMIRVIHRWFPDRQLLIRGPDNISAVKLSRGRQVFAVIVVSLAVMWLLGASLFTAFSLSHSNDAGLTILRLELAQQESAARLARMNADTVKISEQRDIAVAQANVARDKAVAAADQTRDMAIAAAALATDGDRRRLTDLTKQTLTTIGQVESFIKSTGLDPDQLAGGPRVGGSALAGLTAPSPPPGGAGGDQMGSFIEVGPRAHGAPAGNLPVVIFPSSPIDPPAVAAPSAATAPPSSKQSSAAGPAFAAGVTPDRQSLLLAELARLQMLTGVMAKLPVSSPVATISITSPFGFRPDPWTGAREFHVGIDLRGPMGTPVYATAPGVVSFAGVSTGYGNLVVIDHGDGLSTRYSHLKTILVAVGAAVDLHQRIGLLGNTGWSTGPHLLYETRVDGQPFNPLNFIKVDPYDVQN